jgi:hypothetical protein
MLKENFAKSFQKLIYARMDYTSRDLVATPEYRKLRDRHIEVVNKIKELLGPDNAYLVFEEDELGGEIEGLVAENAYKSGFREALEFKQIINAMGIPFQAGEVKDDVAVSKTEGGIGHAH